MHTFQKQKSTISKPDARKELNDTSHSTIWVVVPAFNESGRIVKTLQSLTQFVDNVVVVDDGSSDETAESALSESVWVLRHPLNCGQGAALQTGIDFAVAQGADVVVTFDADGQHYASEISLVVEPIIKGEVDVVLGSRFLGKTENITTTRYYLLKAATLFTRILSGIRVTDTHNGFRALSRLAATKIRLHQNGMGHASEILHKIKLLGLRYCERPVTIHYNKEVMAKGQSSLAAFKVAAQFILGTLVR